uniref:Uncharacterized protein n=1 Tax=Ovis aries TaxID=9940 RepID=A0AC11CCH2_SHEEP
RSILTAADNKEKIEEEGPLRTYVRRLECIDSCSSLSIKFYAKFPKQCTFLNIVAEREGDVYQVGSKGDGTTEEETQQYEELNKERGIPPEHVKDLTQTDDCPQ